jgi:transcriptional regulator with XRE-family HTH domain
VPTPKTRSAAYRRFLSKLKRAREEAGLNQREAARRLRTTQSYVSRCETGDRRVDIVELQAFARAYGKPVSYFLP